MLLHVDFNGWRIRICSLSSLSNVNFKKTTGRKRDWFNIQFWHPITNRDSTRPKHGQVRKNILSENKLLNVFFKYTSLNIEQAHSRRRETHLYQTQLFTGYSWHCFTSVCSGAKWEKQIKIGFLLPAPPFVWIGNSTPCMPSSQQQWPTRWCTCKPWQVQVGKIKTGVWFMTQYIQEDA